MALEAWSRGAAAGVVGLVAARRCGCGDRDGSSNDAMDLLRFRCCAHAATARERVRGELERGVGALRWTVDVRCGPQRVMVERWTVQLEDEPGQDPGKAPRQAQPVPKRVQVQSMRKGAMLSRAVYSALTLVPGERLAKACALVSFGMEHVLHSPFEKEPPPIPPREALDWSNFTLRPVTLSSGTLRVTVDFLADISNLRRAILAAVSHNMNSIPVGLSETLGDDLSPKQGVEQEGESSYNVNGEPRATGEAFTRSRSDVRAIPGAAQRFQESQDNSPPFRENTEIHSLPSNLRLRFSAARKLRKQCSNCNSTASVSASRFGSSVAPFKPILPDQSSRRSMGSRYSYQGDESIFAFTPDQSYDLQRMTPPLSTTPTFQPHSLPPRLIKLPSGAHYPSTSNVSSYTASSLASSGQLGFGVRGDAQISPPFAGSSVASKTTTGSIGASGSDLRSPLVRAVPVGTTGTSPVASALAGALSANPPVHGPLFNRVTLTTLEDGSYTGSRRRSALKPFKDATPSMPLAPLAPHASSIHNEVEGQSKSSKALKTPSLSVMQQSSSRLSMPWSVPSSMSAELVQELMRAVRDDGTPDETDLNECYRDPEQAALDRFMAVCSNPLAMHVETITQLPPASLAALKSNFAELSQRAL